MTESEDFNLTPDREGLLWEEKGITLDWEPSNTRERSLNLTVSPQLQNNGTAYAHVVLIRGGVPLETASDDAKVYRRFRKCPLLLFVHR
jgi:hypothetical protein